MKPKKEQLNILVSAEAMEAMRQHHWGTFYSHRLTFGVFLARKLERLAKRWKAEAEKRKEAISPDR